jgi:indolepyruvate ferredoxin oxidoreductase beta subunit
MAFDQNEGIRNLSFLKEGGTFLVNTHDPIVLENDHLKKYMADKRITTCAFDGTGILNTHMGGKLLFLNVMIAGAACGMKIEGFEEDRVISALKELSPPRYLDANLKVFELGIQAAAK